MNEGTQDKNVRKGRNSLFCFVKFTKELPVKRGASCKYIRYDGGLVDKIESIFILIKRFTHFPLLTPQ